MIYKILICIIFISIVILGSNFTFSDATTNKKTSQQGAAEIYAPYVNFDIDVEVRGIDQAAKTLTSSAERLSISLQKLAKLSKELSDDDRKLIREIGVSINKTAEQLNLAINNLPKALTESHKPLTKITASIFDEVKCDGIQIIVVIVVCILALLCAFYYFFVRPIITVISNLEKTASSIEATVNSVISRDKQQ